MTVQKHTAIVTDTERERLMLIVMARTACNPSVTGTAHAFEPRENVVDHG
jgi:hypothetical protein